jgi:hypothetical protein
MSQRGDSGVLTRMSSSAAAGIALVANIHRHESSPMLAIAAPTAKAST